MMQLLTLPAVQLRESADKTNPFRQLAHCKTDGVTKDHLVLTYERQLAIGALVH